MSDRDRIRITEVGPRDGLQNEPTPIAAAQKVAFVDLLSAAGADEIEVSSFVSPRWVPQLADAAEVFAGIRRRPGIVYSALVPNEKGLEGALAARADKVAVFTAASESFARRNTNASIAETLERFAPVIAGARSAGVPVRGYISCAVCCPYEGRVAPEAVRHVAERLLELGVDELDFGETIGVAGPTDIERLYAGLDGLVEPRETTLHLHDTRGTALACALRALQLGVRSFDASCGGLGGCPYAPGAAGNLATEDLVYLLRSMDLQTGLDLDAQFAAARHIASIMERSLPGRVFAADGG
ncbi:MAG: hydroxymethylglutaryl-CoA lyase [Planctomycetota bacterium]|jgi:hydroxymethylglutaryl-CoA lyase